MRKAIVGLLLVSLVALAGCSFSFWPLPYDPVEANEPVQRIHPIGKIFRPLLNKGDDWYGQPLHRLILHFATDTDQYGNPTGLSDDKQWALTDITIQCNDKAVGDTLFYPPNKPGELCADGFDNAGVWYPTWTGPIEPISGWPRSPYPESGYPFDSCWDTGLPCAYMPAQVATITARAKALALWVRITAPKYGDGEYVLDLPGATPQDSNVFELAVGGPGNIDVIYNGGEETYTVVVPTGWFWISGSWEMPVGATVTSRPF